MQILPAKCIQGYITEIMGIDYEFVEEIQDYSTYTWQITINVTPQIHSNVNTNTPREYDGFDVKIGDWISDPQVGYALKITNVISQDYTTVVFIGEDIDRYNRLNDPSGNQSGALGYGNIIFVYSLGDDGLPIIAGQPSGLMPDTFATNLISRFRYRNLYKKFYHVNQPNHTMIIGDEIYLDVDGLYKKITANRDNKDKLDRIVGFVSEVNIPSNDWFSFKPKGDIVDISNLNLPTKPDDIDTGTSLPIPGTGIAKSRGLPIYLDPTTPGKTTIDKPKKYTTPLYIRLDNPNKAIFLSGGSGSGSSGPLGYYTSTYRVANIAERNALDGYDLELGDQCFIKDDGNGRWAQYLVSEKDLQTNTVTWTLQVKETASDTDAKTANVVLQWDTAQPETVIAQVSGRSRVFNIVVEVIEAFSTDATISIGDDGNNGRLLDNSYIDLSVIGLYKEEPTYQYSAPLTAVKAYYSGGTTGSGNVKVTISYV